MERNELDDIIKAIREETHEAIKHTGHTWIEAAVLRITPAAVNEMFITLGIQTKPPFNSQKDFAFLRLMRIESEDTRKIIKKTLTTYCVNGLLTLVIAGLASWVIVTAMADKVSG